MRDPCLLGTSLQFCGVLPSLWVSFVTEREVRSPKLHRGARAARDLATVGSLDLAFPFATVPGARVSCTGIRAQPCPSVTSASRAGAVTSAHGPIHTGSTGAALSAGRMALILTHVRASLPFPNGLESEGVQ